jgi:hypothetical protein
MLEFDERGVSPGHAAALCGANQPHTSETWDNGISLRRATIIFAPCVNMYFKWRVAPQKAQTCTNNNAITPFCNNYIVPFDPTI